MPHRSDRRHRSDEGSALVAAILAMLLFAVFALSVSVLADLESRLALNHKAAQQAVTLAHAGLEHGRNMLRDAADPAIGFNGFIASASARQLGVPTAGIPLGPGRYWVRVDNDCAAPGGFAGTPAFVPTVVEDNDPNPCSDTSDQNETAVLSAWSEVTNGAGTVIGRARLRAHYTIGNPWKHSCYDQDGGLCIEDAVGGCNSNPCIDPSDPHHPNGPATGDLPIPTGIRCGTGGNPPYLAIDPEDIPADVLASGAITTNAPCVIYPYYEWALRQAAPTRTRCRLITSGGYGTDLCSGAGELSPPGTLAMDNTNSVCTDPLTASKCHGMVFFGPGTGALALAEQADISIGGTGGTHAGCMGTRSGSSVCPGSNSSVVVYVMGKLTLTNNVEINGTVVLHGNHVGGGGANTDFGITGTVRVTTSQRPQETPPLPACEPLLSLAGTDPKYCGYPLAILAYNPNEAAPTTALGQTIQLDLSNITSLVSGLIYSGGTADFNPLTVDGGLIAWDVNITNTASRITYNPEYGNAAPPPFFSTPADGSGVRMFPATWVHCTYYANETAGPTPCS